MFQLFCFANACSSAFHAQCYMLWFAMCFECVWLFGALSIRERLSWAPFLCQWCWWIRDSIWLVICVFRKHVPESTSRSSCTALNIWLSIYFTVLQRGFRALSIWVVLALSPHFWSTVLMNSWIELIGDFAFCVKMSQDVGRSVLLHYTWSRAVDLFYRVKNSYKEVFLFCDDMSQNVSHSVCCFVIVYASVPFMF